MYRVSTSESFGEREMLWEHELQTSVSTAFRVLPNFHEYFYNSIETRTTCFLFLLENTATKKRKTTSKFPLLAKSVCEQLALVLCFCVMETGFSTNQRAYFLRTVF